MKKRNLVFGFLIIATIVLSTACGAKAQPTPTVDPGVVMTQVAETVSAEMTQIALMTPSPTATLAATPDTSRDPDCSNDLAGVFLLHTNRTGKRQSPGGCRHACGY